MRMLWTAALAVTTALALVACNDADEVSARSDGDVKVEEAEDATDSEAGAAGSEDDAGSEDAGADDAGSDDAGAEPEAGAADGDEDSDAAADAEGVQGISAAEASDRIAAALGAEEDTDLRHDYDSGYFDGSDLEEEFRDAGFLGGLFRTFTIDGVTIRFQVEEFRDAPGAQAAKDAVQELYPLVETVEHPDLAIVGRVRESDGVTTISYGPVIEHLYVSVYAIGEDPAAVEQAANQAATAVMAALD